VELFAAHGPAAVSVRDIARHAGVNQGLIYRHFASKDALLAEAIERGSSGLFPAALAADGFDLERVIHQLHHQSVAPRLIARTLVDDIDITTVRRQFPVLRALLDAYPPVPRVAAVPPRGDPRLAVAAAAALAGGSAVWGAHLADELGLGAPEAVETAVVDLARMLLDTPRAARLGRPPHERSTAWPKW
jgi:AcrR family transcriptional regulator